MYYHLGRSRLGSVTEPCTPNVVRVRLKTILRWTQSSPRSSGLQHPRQPGGGCNRANGFIVQACRYRSSAFHCPVAHSRLLLIAKNQWQQQHRESNRPLFNGEPPRARQSEARTEETGPSVVSPGERSQLQRQFNWTATTLKEIWQRENLNRLCYAKDGEQVPGALAVVSLGDEN